jgi:hypothetical protein
LGRINCEPTFFFRFFLSGTLKKPCNIPTIPSLLKTGIIQNKLVLDYFSRHVCLGQLMSCCIIMLVTHIPPLSRLVFHITVPLLCCHPVSLWILFFFPLECLDSLDSLALPVLHALPFHLYRHAWTLVVVVVTAFVVIPIVVTVRHIDVSSRCIAVLLPAAGVSNSLPWFPSPPGC